MLVLPKKHTSPDRLSAVFLAFWHVAACRRRPAVDDNAAAGLQKTGIVVMGAALFMSRWQQAGPAANILQSITHECNQKPGLTCVLHIKCSSSSIAPQKAPTLLAAFIARHHHVRGVEPLHHADAQVWHEAPQVKTP